MTTDLREARIRTSLEGWAARVDVALPTPQPGPTPPASAVAVSVQPWRRRPLVLAGGLAALIALIAALVYAPGGTRVLVAGGQPGGGAGGGASSATPGGAPLIILDDPAWQVAYFTTGPDGSGAAYTEYQFSGPASGYLQISFYPTDGRTGPIASFAPTPSATSSVGGVVDVRGTQGGVTNEGPPRWRLDWDEAGFEWEADGSPFAGAQGLAAFLTKVQVVETTTWQAHMPAGLANDIRSHPADDVTWYRGQAITCLNPGAPVVVSPSGGVTVPQTPCSAAPATGPAASASPAGPVPAGGSPQALPYCIGTALSTTPGQTSVPAPPLHCFATRDQEDQYLLAQNHAVPDPIPTHLYSFTFTPDAQHPYCGGQLDLCFATVQQLSDYGVQGTILKIDNGHATFAPIVVPTGTVRPATATPSPGPAAAPGTASPSLGPPAASPSPG